MAKVNSEIKKVISRVKDAQSKLQTLINSQDWVDEARKYAERQSKEVKKLFSGDLAKVKTFLERERKELERFQKQIPGEVKKFRSFVQGQKKELEKLLKNVRATGAAAKKTTKKKAGGTRKKASSQANASV